MLALYSRYQIAKESLKRCLKSEEEGQTIVEYVLLIVLIALVVFAAQPGLSDGLINAFERITSLVETPGNSF